MSNTQEGQAFAAFHTTGCSERLTAAGSRMQPPVMCRARRPPVICTDSCQDEHPSAMLPPEERPWGLGFQG